MARDYKCELVQEQRKLEQMLADLDTLQARIARQKRIVAAHTELVNAIEDCPAPSGLVTGITDAVRTVFMGAEKPLNPAEVKSRVESLGIPAQQNLLASVHTIIRRLLAGGEIEAVGEASPGGGYRWKRPTFGQRIAGRRIFPK
jgi:hypothetical protein